jgi:hypothetical protein
MNGATVLLKNGNVVIGLGRPLNLRCPLCESDVGRIPNDPDNRAACVTDGCWLRSNPMPLEVARKLCHPKGI